MLQLFPMEMKGMQISSRTQPKQSIYLMLLKMAKFSRGKTLYQGNKGASAVSGLGNQVQEEVHLVLTSHQ